MYNYNNKKAHYIIGAVETAAGKIPVVSTKLTVSDITGAVRVRLGIRRHTYRIAPGLYAIGTPDDSSPVFVTANYKLSFDYLRRELGELNAWLMVLDTNGINVWCAAGKGTFGTVELIKRIYYTKLKNVVSHRNIILPQLGAPGVSAYEVARKTGFKVIYGPVRAEDIKKFIASDNTATKEMRTVRFDMKDRLAVTPTELVHSWKLLSAVFIILAVLNLLTRQHFIISELLTASLLNFIPYIGAVIIGSFLVPMLLPWIPFRAFSLKGLLLGIVWGFIVILFHSLFGFGISSWFGIIGHALAVVVIASFLSLNFTGCTTYTSFSGVRNEVKAAAIPMIVGMSSAIVLIIIDKILLFV